MWEWRYEACACVECVMEECDLCVYRRGSLRIQLGVLTTRRQNRVVSTSLSWTLPCSRARKDTALSCPQEPSDATASPAAATHNVTLDDTHTPPHSSV